MDCFQFKLVALLTNFCNLFDMKQKIKNKFVLKSATYKIVFELGTIAASYFASSLKQESGQAKEVKQKVAHKFALKPVQIKKAFVL
jgi:hypothetical protein